VEKTDGSTASLWSACAWKVTIYSSNTITAIPDEIC
jgi:hypothetical protein